MASEPDKPRDIESIKEVIRLLNLALEDCQKLLIETEEAVRASGQDNHPPKRP